MRYIALASVVLLSASCRDSNMENTHQNKSEVQVSDEYVHPKLGALYAENFAWQTDDVSVPFSEAAIAVSFTNCSAEGPLEAALSGYDWIESHWPQVRSLIQEQAFAFYEPYADAVPGVPRFDAADQLWETEVLLSIEISSKHQFSITMRFEWQEEDDPHQITFYVVDGRCQTHSVDG